MPYPYGAGFGVFRPFTYLSQCPGRGVRPKPRMVMAM